MVKHMKKKIIATLGTTALLAGLALGAAAPAQAGVQIYQFSGYKTSLGDFGRGTTYVGDQANDKASSVTISSPAAYGILYQNRDRGGRASGTYYTGTPDLAPWNFDNITSSIG